MVPDHRQLRLPRGFIYCAGGSRGSQSLYSRFLHRPGISVGRYCIPSGCREHFRHHEICKDTQVDLHDSRRRKPAERRFIPDYIPVCAGCHRNRTIYLAAGSTEFCMDDHRRCRHGSVAGLVFYKNAPHPAYRCLFRHRLYHHRTLSDVLGG